MPVLARIQPCTLPGDGHRAFRLTSPSGRVSATLVPSQGGVLSSLCLDGYGELLYRANDFSPVEAGEWTGRAPILWPAVGRNYPLEPNSSHDPAALKLGWRNPEGIFPMPIHGFARLMNWKMSTMGANSETAHFGMEVVDNVETLRFYPYAFRLLAVWKVDEYGIEQAVTVQSRDNLRFGLGNHLTLAVPDETVFDTAALHTSAPARLEVNRFGLLEDKPIRLEARSGIALTEPWTQNAALVTGPEGYCELRFAAGPIVRLSHRLSQGQREARRDDFVFVLYGRRDRGFYCVEPWLGRPNGLQTGRGAVSLQRGAPFTWKMRIDLEGL